MAAIGCAAVIVAAVWLSREVDGFKQARRALQDREREWQRLSSASEGNAESARKAEGEASARAEEIGRLWQASRLALATRDGPGASRTEEAFFDLMGFVERMRGCAASGGVSVGENERFGFSEYANVGPEPERIEDVERQRKLAEVVLRALFEMGPKELIRCAREKGDAREVKRRWSLEEPDMVKAIAYRVTFVGRTEVLRGFLNRMEASDLPIVVSAVDVSPVEEEDVENVGTRLVKSAWSEFSVTAEWLEAEAGVVASADPEMERHGVAAAASASFRWEARSGVGDDGWSYDVFTSPDVFYDSVSGRLTAVMPGGAGQPARNQKTDTPVAALELLRATAEPYRVQLVGFAGAGDGDRGVFENARTTEVFVAGAGERLPGLEVIVEEIAIERTERSWPESMSVGMRAAKAKVRDERSGETIWLTSDERRWNMDPLAVVKISGMDDEREVRVGEEIAIAGARYRLVRVEPSPLAIELAPLGGETGGTVKLAARAGGQDL